MRGTRLELRPAGLRKNARRARRLAGDSRVYAMLKADGYGHGLALAARAMESEVDGFGVAVLEEALTLRQLGTDLPLMLLQGFLDRDELAVTARLGLETVIHSTWQVELLECHPPSEGLCVWLKVNTGMHRLGVPAQEAEVLLRRLRAVPGVRVSGVMTHFACADEEEDPYTLRQLEGLRGLAGGDELPWSAANSAALCRYPETHGALVRPGIMLYGSSPLIYRNALDLGLTVTQRLSARIIAVNALETGDPVGYGATWTAPGPGRVGVVSIGYGDGYPRHAPSGTPVAVNGQRTQLVGRVSMDLITVDLTDLPDTGVGDEVELWGDVVHVDEVARACGTISYELFCQVTGRVERLIT